MLRNVLLLVVFLAVVLWWRVSAVRAQDAPKVTADSWFCSTSSYSDVGCFQYGKIVLLVPSVGYVSLVSGDSLSLDANDFSRLQDGSQGLIPKDLGK